MLKFMHSRFRGRCAGTGRTIHRGEEIAFDTITRKAYGVGTAQHSEAKGLKPAPRPDDGYDMHTAMLDEANDRWADANL